MELLPTGKRKKWKLRYRFGRDKSGNGKRTSLGGFLADSTSMHVHRAAVLGAVHVPTFPGLCLLCSSGPTAKRPCRWGWTGQRRKRQRGRLEPLASGARFQSMLLLWSPVGSPRI